MKNKQFPPRGGPPLVYRCRGIPGDKTHVFLTDGTRVFLTAHSFRWHVPIPLAIGIIGITVHSIPEGLHVCSLHIRDGTTNRARDGTEIDIRDDAGIAVGFSEGMAMPSQRRADALPGTGLQPHLIMWLKPEQWACSNLIRQLGKAIHSGKQTACPDTSGAIKQTACPGSSGVINEAAIITGKGNDGHIPVCRTGRRGETWINPRDGTWVHPRNGTAIRIRDGTPVRIRDDTEIHIRDGTTVKIRDGTIIRIRDDTDLHIRDGTGPGSHNPAARQTVHTPEWERYGVNRGKCRIANILRRSQSRVAILHRSLP